MNDVTIDSVTLDEHGNIVIDCDLTQCPDVEDDAHRIIIEQPAAIANRMAAYGLATEQDALEAIVREHTLRLSTLAPKSDALVDVHGGTDDRITITSGSNSDAATVLATPAIAAQIANALPAPDQPPA